MGIQPILFNAAPEDVGSLGNGTILAGGMQLYFEHHNFERVPFFDDASYYFRSRIRQNKPIQLTLVEIYPPDRTFSENLSGRALKREIELQHEEKFGINFNVDVKQVTLDYELLKIQPGEDFFSNFDRVLEDNIHNRFGTDHLFLYYFTDTEAFAEVDRRLAHPRKYGAYMAGWQENSETYFHELGHVLQLYHHFDSLENAGKLEAHFSIPCIMNYRVPYVSENFCPLCMYALGLDPPVNTPNPLAEYVSRFFKLDGSKLILYKNASSGVPLETGQYDFGALQVYQLQWDKDFIVLHYGYSGGDQYLGKFSEDMIYLGEYNMGSLDIYKYLVTENKVYAIYKNSQGTQYLGAFDDKMKFISEIGLDERAVSSLSVAGNGLEIAYSNDQDLSVFVPFSSFVK